MPTIGNQLKYNSLIEKGQIILEKAIIVHFIVIEELKTQSLYSMSLSLVVNVVDHLSFKKKKYTILETKLNEGLGSYVP